MTTIIFMPDERTLVTLEDSLTSAEILQAVNEGDWTPPQPYASLVPPGELSLRAVCQGRRVIIVAVTPLTFQDDQPSLPNTHQLSPRQSQVLQGLFQGLTTKEIAFRLGLKPRTVKMHIAALKNRFGASTRAQSVGIAANLGLLESNMDLESEK